MIYTRKAEGNKVKHFMVIAKVLIDKTWNRLRIFRYVWSKRMIAIKISLEREGIVWNVSCFKSGTLSCYFHWKIFNERFSSQFMWIYRAVIIFCCSMFLLLLPFTIFWSTSQVIYIKGHGEISRCSWIASLCFFCWCWRKAHSKIRT